MRECRQFLGVGEAQLAAAAQADQVVTLHPAAVSRYLADIKQLSDVAADAAALDEPELVATLRSLVEAIIVHAPANSDDFTVEIRASLSELTMPGPLVKPTGSGVSDGSPLPLRACLHHHTATKSRLASVARFTRERSKVRSLCAHHFNDLPDNSLDVPQEQRDRGERTVSLARKIVVRAGTRSRANSATA